jgi:hypothetical protein
LYIRPRIFEKRWAIVYALSLASRRVRLLDPGWISAVDDLHESRHAVGVRHTSVNRNSVAGAAVVKAAVVSVGWVFI